nr:MAG: RNA-dependent RNA polymerase [Narnaviridae sp.]
MARTALAEHRENLMTPFSCDPRLLGAMRRSARRFARKFVRKEYGILSAGVPNHASCSEFTLAKGGFRRYVSEIPEHPEARKILQMFPKAEVLPVQDMSSLIRDASLQFTAYDRVTGVCERPIPPSVPHALLERGLKTRVITKSSGALLLLGHPVRRKLLKALRGLPEFSAPFLGRVDEEVASRFTGAYCEVVLSTDLKNASDLLPHDLVSALIDGLSQSGRFSAFEIASARAVLGPQLVKFSETETVQIRRGILMGLPLTWIALSLIHRFWWEEAVRISADRRRIKLREAFERNRFMICGDDAIFVGEKDVAEVYHCLMAQSGAVISPGKHYIRDQAPYRGVFLERLFQFNLDAESRVIRVLRDPSVPLRGLSDPTGSGTLEEVLGERHPIKVPKGLATLIVISSIWKSHPQGELRLLNFVERNSHLRRLARSYGLQDGAPLDEGGSGLPCQQVSLEVSARRRLVNYLPRHCRPKLPRLAASVTDPLWSLAQEITDGDLASFFADGTFIRSATVDSERGLLYLEDSEDPNGSFYRTVPMGEAKFAELAHVRMYEEMASISGVPAYRKIKSLQPRAFVQKLSEYFKSLPKINVRSVAPFPLQFPSNELSVELTKLPDGSRVFPIWLGPKSATEATLRRRLYDTFFGL